MKNKPLEFFLGIALIVVSVFMLLKNTYVTSFGFYSFRFGRYGVNTGAILIVLLIIAIVAAVAKPNKLTKAIVGVLLAAIVLSLILGIQMHLMGMTAIDVILIVGAGAVGIGLLLRSLIGSKEKK